MKKGIILALALTLANTVSASDSGISHEVSPTLLSELNEWLDAETEFVKRAHQPDIEIIGREQAENLRDAGERSSGRTRGLYDDENQTIYLAEPWSSSNPHDISVLLHEMVHHRQSGQHWYCQQAQEWRAYKIQAQWLAEHQIADEFYWPAIVLQSSCAKRDIHPE